MRTAGDEIIVSGTSPEIVPTWLSMADFAIRRAHKSALEERHVRAQILKRSDCQLLEHFLSAHVFALNMIQSCYDLQAGCPGFRSGGFLSAALFREIHRFHFGSFQDVQERVDVANGRNSVPFVRITPLPCVCGGFNRS